MGPAFADAGPFRPGGPEVLVGGFAPAALARVGRFGHGLLCAAQPAWAAGLFAAVARSWVEHGRSGAPRNVGQVNVALGPEAVVADARTAMADYYAFTGDASRMTAGLCTTRAAVRDTISAFADLGADEVVLYCWATDPTQLDRLADLTA